MREYKFRAWDKCNESMIESRNILKICMSRLNQEPYIIVYLKKWMHEHREIKESDKSYTNEFELMQYTGFKDDNGVEIYEGDIVRTHFSFNHNVEQEPFIITWNKDKAMFEGVKPEKIKDDYLRRFSFFPEQEFIYEIVGNIYENPELLKEKL